MDRFGQRWPGRHVDRGGYRKVQAPSERSARHHPGLHGRGKTAPGAPIFQGIAEITNGGALFDEVQTKIHAKYGWQIPIVKRVSRLQGRFEADQTFGDTVVLITLAGRDEDGLDDPRDRPSARVG